MSHLPSEEAHMIKILALGDSLTRGYHAYGRIYSPYTDKLEALIFEHRQVRVFIDNRGIDGQTSSEILERLKNYTSPVHGTKYDYAIILAGTNDLAKPNAPGTIKNINEMMTIAKDNGIKPFVMTIPNSGFDDKVPQVVSTRALINQEIRRVYPGSFIDLQEKIPHLEMPADERKTMWDDNLHLSEKGYARMAEAIFAEIGDQLAKKP